MKGSKINGVIMRVQDGKSVFLLGTELVAGASVPEMLARKLIEE